MHSLALRTIAVSALLGAASAAAAYEFRNFEDPFAQAEPPAPAAVEAEQPAPEVTTSVNTEIIVPHLLGDLNQSAAASLAMIGYVGNSERSCALLQSASGASACKRAGQSFLGHLVLEVSPVRVSLQDPAGERSEHYLLPF